MLRKFRIKRGEPKDSEARVKLQKELFAFNKCVDHGFPHKPNALSYDPKLKLLAVGTKSGAVRVYGAPGVELEGQHAEEATVTKLFFLPEQGRLVTLCNDNTLHLWEININDERSELQHVKEFSMENRLSPPGGASDEAEPEPLSKRNRARKKSKLKAISACCLTNSAEQLLIGTEGGNIHLLDVTTFQLLEHIIYQDVVMQNVPDDFKVNPGAVESIAEHPTDGTKFLIGYNRGLIVLWDNKENKSDQTYNATQQLESLSWHQDGTQFMSSHADGSYIIWSISDSTKPKEQATTPYGPFPCKAINKIQWKTAKADPFIIFSGGMPRASYGDRNTVSVMQGSNHVVFDFTSRVIDFALLSATDEIDPELKTEYEEPHTLVVLAEEEMVVIDLQSENWPTFRQPYMASMHSSAITCSSHVSNIPEQLWTKISDAGETQSSGFSSRTWPVNGGKSLGENINNRDLLLTGHEDGTVRFWDASTTCLQLLYKLSTASVFGGDISHAENADNTEEEWPPFRKVGTFDPYSDDPRLGIQKITLCPVSETLVVAGTAGQVVVLQMEREERELEISSSTVNVVSDRDNFVWKGHDALSARSGENKFAAGFQPVSVCQLYPPAACTALALQTEYQMVAAGTGHGFALYDYAQKKEVTTRCTLNPHDLTGTGDSAMSRRKSFKKSLRESFRKLRKGRSQRKAKKDDKPKEEAKPAEEKKEGEEAEEEKGEAKEGEGEAGEAEASQPPQAGEQETVEGEKPAEAAPEPAPTADTTTTATTTSSSAPLEQAESSETANDSAEEKAEVAITSEGGTPEVSPTTETKESVGEAKDASTEGAAAAESPENKESVSVAELQRLVDEEPVAAFVDEGRVGREATPEILQEEEGTALPLDQQSGDKPTTDLDAPTPTESAPAASSEAAAPTTPEHKSVERAIEARPVDDSMGSMVRALHFADTFLVNAAAHSPTLWAGTNAGTIYVYSITLPANDKRDTEAVTAKLGKEIQLKHRAPVISICVMDRNAYPLPEPLDVQNERAKAPDMTGGHQVVICSEEQFKIFQLPTLRAVVKYKLTAHTGSRVRKIGFINFRSRSDENYSENDFACLTNQGDLSVYTIPGLRKQLNSQCVKKENVSGVASVIFTKNGEGYYLASPSEFSRFSLSARLITSPVCLVELKEGMRPPPPEPEPEPEPEVETPAAAEAEAPAAAEEGEAKEGGVSAVVSGLVDDATTAVTDAVANITLDSVADTTVDSEPAGDITQEIITDMTSETKTLVSEMKSEVKTITSETLVKAEEGMTTITKTIVTTVTESGTSAAGGETSLNVDDDTKAASQGTSEETTSECTENAEPLPELRITEEGDDPTPVTSKKRGHKSSESQDEVQAETQENVS